MQISAGRLRPRDVIDARITIAVGGISIDAFYVDVEPMHATLDVVSLPRNAKDRRECIIITARGLHVHTYVVLI